MSVPVSDHLFKGVEARPLMLTAPHGLMQSLEGVRSQSVQSFGFSDVLQKMVTETTELQKTAENTNRQFLDGDMGKIHENMIALEKAHISLKMMVSVRNKLLESYKELMHLNG